MLQMLNAFGSENGSRNMRILLRHNVLLPTVKPYKTEIKAC